MEHTLDKARISSIDRVKNVRIDKDNDIIFCSVGLYKFFFANGKIGKEAYLLYSHLMFTARLQETNRVKAKNIYLMQGLEFGEKKIERIKSFLKKAGLIRYVRSMPVQGNNRLGEVYIEITNFWNSEAIKGKITAQSEVSTTANSAVVENDPSSTPSDSAGVHKCMNSSTPSISTAVDGNGSSSKRQMLNINNLNALREKEKKAEQAELPNELEELSLSLAHIFYNDFNRRFKRQGLYSLKPSQKDLEKASCFTTQLETIPPRFQDTFKRCVSRYFIERYWFNRDKRTQKPCLTFSNFISHFHEILEDIFPVDGIEDNDRSSRKSAEDRKIIDAEQKALDCLLRDLTPEEIESVKSDKNVVKFGELYFKSRIIELHKQRFTDHLDRILKSQSNKEDL